MMWIQMASIFVFGAMLLAAVRLLANAQTIEVMDSEPAVLKVIQPEQKKARWKNRRISWAAGRLLYGHKVCRKCKKEKAFCYLKQLAKDSDSRISKRALNILGELAKGNGDPKYQSKALEFYRPLAPRNALKIQVAIEKVPVVKMRNKRTDSAALPQAAAA